MGNLEHNPAQLVMMIGCRGKGRIGTKDDTEALVLSDSVEMVPLTEMHPAWP